MKLKRKPPLAYSVAKMLQDSGYNESRNLHCGDVGYRCRDRLFCPSCCDAQYSLPLIKELVRPMEENEQAFGLTLSQQHEAAGVRFLFITDVKVADDAGHKKAVEALPLEKFGMEFITARDLERFVLTWKIAMDALRQSVLPGKKKHISGLLIFPRLVVQFRPLRVLPFVNALAITDRMFGEAEARAIRRIQRNKLGNTRRLTQQWHAWFHGRQLASMQDQANVIVHNSQPIQIEEALTAASDRPIPEIPELEIFLSNVVKVYRDMPRVHRLGVFHPHHCNYVNMNHK